MNDKLKPCPHCKEVPEIYAIGRDWYRLATKCEQGCINFEREVDYSYSKNGYNSLIADWNYRPIEDDLLEALEALNQEMLGMTGMYGTYYKGPLHKKALQAIAKAKGQE